MSKLIILFVAMSFSAVCFADEHTTEPSTTQASTESSPKVVEPTSKTKVTKKVTKDIKKVKKVVAPAKTDNTIKE